MNGGPITKQVTGTITHVETSGHGPNSGSITIVIQPDEGSDAFRLSVGILPDPDRDPNPDNPMNQYAMENGVFAAHLSVALAALTSGRKVTASYFIAPANLLYGLSIFR